MLQCTVEATKHVCLEYEVSQFVEFAGISNSGGRKIFCLMSDQNAQKGLKIELIISFFQKTVAKKISFGHMQKPL